MVHSFLSVEQLSLSRTGLVDSSGLRFHVTRKLRAHDAGIMELGLEYTDKMALPPGQDIATLTGYCIQQCTEVVCVFCFRLIVC